MFNRKLSTSPRLLALAFLALLLVGCTEVSMVNNSKDKIAYLFVTLPERASAYSITLLPGQSQTSVVDNDGYYGVAVLNDAERQKHIDDLNRVRETLDKVIKSGSTTPAEVSALKKQIEIIKAKMVADLKSGRSCTGLVNDRQSARVVADWDAQSQQWTLDCQVVEIKTESDE